MTREEVCAYLSAKIGVTFTVRPRPFRPSEDAYVANLGPVAGHPAWAVFPLTWQP